MSKSVVTPVPAKAPAASVSTVGGFLAGGVAACGAVTFTNPIELIKIRMQLQGELSKNANAPKLYKNPAQAFAVIYKNEGIRGLQQGLFCGYLYQIGLNGCRLGLYEPSRKLLTQTFTNSFEEGKPVPQSLPINVASGIISGVAGAVIASPFFLVKTRMQSYNKSLHGHASVGQQTYYRTTWDGLSQIYNAEGLKGLWRGVNAAAFRTGCGSAAQLPVYNAAKHFLLNNHIVADHSIGLHFLSSCCAGLGVAIVMNPGDVILTRVYNQKGDLYKGPLDCFVKTVQSEGVAALYKGFWAQLFRIGPHSILTLMFMEQCLKVAVKVEKKLGFQ